MLSSDAPAFVELTAGWQTVSSRREPLCGGGQQLYPLSQHAGVGRAVLLIEEAPQHATADRFSHSHLAALAAAFWSRPKRQSWSERRRLAIQPRYVAGAVVLALAALLFPCRYRIACSAHVEPVLERVVAAPFEATLAECLVAPGDMVTAGQPLLRLDGRPLRLEREAIESEIHQAEKNHSIALASGRIAEAQLAALERTRLQRRRELLETRLQQLTLVSPLAGVVVTGDHRRTVGSPVLTGQSLLEIAPLEELEVEVEIPEFEIRYAEVGQPVETTLQAFRERRLTGSLTTIYPSAEVRAQENVFVGLMRIENIDAKLRPGMRGTATLYGPVRPWMWSWVRPGLERIRQFVGG